MFSASRLGALGQSVVLGRNALQKCDVNKMLMIRICKRIPAHRLERHGSCRRTVFFLAGKRAGMAEEKCSKKNKNDEVLPETSIDDGMASFL